MRRLPRTVWRVTPWPVWPTRTTGSAPGRSTPIPDLNGRSIGAGLRSTPPRSLRERPEMDVFDRISIRGVLRVGRLVIAKSPSVYLAAAKAVLDKALQRAHLPRRWLKARAAPYSIAQPWARADQAFVARHARGA